MPEILTEAQIIVDRMMATGLQPYEIAKQIGVRSQQIRDIRRRKSSGNAYADKLRVVAASVVGSIPTQIDREEPATRGDTQGVTPETATTPDRPTATIDAEDAPKDERTALDKAKDRIKEMILGGGDGPSITAAAPRKSASTLTGRRSLFVDQVTPIVALAVSLGADMLIADPYKPVAPSEDEASALVRPWIAIMARQLEIAGQLSETSLDIIAALGATALYGRRAHATYKAIHAQEVANGNISVNQRNNGANRSAASTPAQSNRSDGAARSGSYPQNAPGAGYAAAHDRTGGGPIDGRHIGHDGSGFDPIADLYTRDALGRRAAGLD